MLRNESRWLSCFDRSAVSTRAYVRAVYGEAGHRAFDWTQLQVVFPWFLTHSEAAPSNESVLQCLLRSGSDYVYQRLLMHAVWVGYRSHQSTGHTPYTAFINRGGKRGCRPGMLGWVEVMHQPSVSESRKYQVSWSDQLWMYRVNGSGLWYHAGRTLLCSDTIDLAAYLQYEGYNRRVGDTKPPLFDAARRRLAGSFDTVSLDSHIDGACCHRMVMHELISISSNASRRCPVSASLRRGAAPRKLRMCDCTGMAGTVPSGPRHCPTDRGLHCDIWASRERRAGTLAKSCADPHAQHRCAGACCNHTLWPHGMLIPRPADPWNWVQPVC